MRGDQADVKLAARRPAAAAAPVNTSSRRRFRHRVCRLRPQHALLSHPHLTLVEEVI